MRGLVHCMMIVALVAPTVAVAAAPATTRATTEGSLDPVIPSVDFRDTTFEKAIDTLRDMTKVNIVVHWHVLEAAGLERTTPVDLRVTKLQLARVIELLGELASRSN